MKTKFLFYSLAVAAAMASCTQEVIEAPVNEAQDLSIRPTLGEVVLTEGEDVASRLAATGAGARPVFATGDKMGAAIMDAPKYPGQVYDEDYRPGNYNIVEYYSSNAGFLKDGNAWYMNSDQPLVEGNYLFYAPYNPNMVLRSPFEVRVPQRQDISTEKSALDAYYADKNNVVVIGHQFLAYQNGQAQRPSVEYYDVMSYPKFTIVNNFDGYLSQFERNTDGTIKKTQAGAIAKSDSLVEYTGAIKLDSIQIAYADGKDGKATNPALIGGLLTNQKIVNVLNPYANGWKTPLDNHLEDLLNENAKITTDSIITTFVAGGKEIAKGDTTSFFAIMPADKFGKNELQANIYVTIGEKQYLFTVANVNFATKKVGEADVNYADANGVTTGGYKFNKNSVTLLQGQIYPQEELNYDANTNKVSAKEKVKGSILRMELVGGKVSGDKDENKNKDLLIAQEVSADVEIEEGPTETDLIDNNEEFIQFFADTYNNATMTEGAEMDEANGVFAFSTNTTATINSELINALADKQVKGSIKINKPLVIANDVQVTAINTTDRKVTFKSNTNKSYVIELGTDYTVNATYVQSANLSLHVKGTHSISSEATFGNIRNAGTLTVNAKLTATTFDNVKRANLNVSANIVNPVTNNGTINVTNATTAMLTVKGGTGTISIDYAADLKTPYVTVKGGTQTGIVKTTSIDKTVVKTSDAISWVNALGLTTGDFKPTSEIMAEFKDINRVELTADVVFGNESDTLSMNDVALVMKTANSDIYGESVSQTIITDLNIIDENDESVVTLTNIDAWGEAAANLYADGITAKWNGASVGEIDLVVEGTNWTVNNEKGLEKLADIVDYYDQAQGNPTIGVTVKLARDLNLSGINWEPIGNIVNVLDDNASNPNNNRWFKGTFDGNGKTIKNLKSETRKGTGLFAAVRGAIIKDLKIENAEIISNHYAGVITGYAYGVTIDNCEVTGATVNCTSFDSNDDGDKAGTFVGHMQNGTNLITNSKASNSTVTAGRDAGQLVGAGYEKDVVNCTIENVKVSANGTSTGANINDEPVGRKF